ncbi:unnamed protein product [Rhizoctonia solani]|uniref:HNH nuclease domain-containing protein n=1 Tax=Rhizoctonia solani TaxID=456999 RepID=A0A8H3E8Y8_9AGAM|nr:unnamed protein product [Rhizoctonia solani]CAE7210983.1 unnamed protein product [Rhizoctonia solani]
MPQENQPVFMDPNAQTHSASFDHRGLAYEPGDSPVHSNDSHVSVAMKGELSKLGPDGERCPITCDVQALEHRYLVDPAIPIEIQEKLEYAWGLEPGELELDTASNLIWLRRDMLEQFDCDKWTLVPTKEVLKEMISFNGTRRPNHFLKSFPNKIWDYHVVQLLSEPLSLVDEIDSPSFNLHDVPEVIQSHVHPFFVAHNTNQKTCRIRDSGAGFPPKYLLQLALCNLLRPLWGKPIPIPHTSQQPSNTPYTPSSTRSWPSLPSEQRSNRAAERLCCFDGVDSSHPVSGVGAGVDVPQNCQHMASPIVNQYLPTPKQSVGFASAGECRASSSWANSPTIHWTSIDDWVEGVESAMPGEDPYAGGTEQARQYLVDYGSEETQSPPLGP